MRGRQSGRSGLSRLILARASSQAGAFGLQLIAPAVAAACLKGLRQAGRGRAAIFSSAVLIAAGDGPPAPLPINGLGLVWLYLIGVAVVAVIYEAVAIWRRGGGPMD